MRETLAPARAGAALRHLISPADLSASLIENLLDRALAFELGGTPMPRRDGRLLATIFYEPSTRTRFSFEAAMYRLGGQVLSAESAGKTSSAAKGETLEDTIRVLSGYADAIAIRHPEIGTAARSAEVASVPVINAGDGAGHHPTQALLDLYTIRKELGRLDRLRVALVGDLRHGRTVRSLALLLSQFPDNELVLVSPPGLRMSEDVIGALGPMRVEETSDLAAVVPTLDVLYQTRIQAERFESAEVYERYRGVYVVTVELMRALPEHALLMHPLPRVGEIDPAVDADPRAAYFRQSRNGVWARMAVLDWVLGA
ncbi:MAG TPA: aspartate carbamoyltransferase [Candidatus Dormibacteraeota bacterium]|nr:aspartate carbamoyltransferase [Candidatus Dormibacteraeota bacterium]